MIIPNYVDIPISEMNGEITPEWKLILQQLLIQLNLNAGNEGLVAPSQTTDNIGLLTQSQNGTIIYDSTTQQFKGYINGVWKIFTLT